MHNAQFLDCALCILHSARVAIFQNKLPEIVVKGVVILDARKRSGKIEIELFSGSIV